NHAATTAAIATSAPALSNVPGTMIGSRAYCSNGSVAGNVARGTAHGPSSMYRVSWIATYTSIREVITSLMPRLARSKPGIAPHTAPAATPAAIATMGTISSGRSGIIITTAVAAVAET